MAIHRSDFYKKGKLLTHFIRLSHFQTNTIHILLLIQVRSEDGALFLDMKVGNLLQQRVTRVQTEQAHEISRLVRQYITMAQSQHRDRRD